MPKTWLYFVALVMPLLFRFIIINTGFVDWLWYRQDYLLYNIFTSIRWQPQFLEFVGGWSFAVFIITIFSFWATEHNEEAISDQFLMLPIAFIPFPIFGDIVLSHNFDPATLYTYPLIIIPVGYIYIFIWVIFIRVLDRMQLIM